MGEKSGLTRRDFLGRLAVSGVALSPVLYFILTRNWSGLISEENSSIDTVRSPFSGLVEEAGSMSESEMVDFIFSSDQSMHIENLSPKVKEALEQNDSYNVAIVGNSFVGGNEVWMPFENNLYNFGTRDGLQEVVDKYSLLTRPDARAGSIKVGAAGGATLEFLLDRMMCNEVDCSGRSTIDYVIQEGAPRFVFIGVGTNDEPTPERFIESLDVICQKFLDNDIIPILMTFPMQMLQSEEVRQYNNNLENSNPNAAKIYRDIYKVHLLWNTLIIKYAQSENIPIINPLPRLSELPMSGTKSYLDPWHLTFYGTRTGTGQADRPNFDLARAMGDSAAGSDIVNLLMLEAIQKLDE